MKNSLKQNIKKKKVQLFLPEKKNKINYTKPKMN